MTHARTTALDEAFLVLLHHVVFELSDEQGAALMADDLFADNEVVRRRRGLTRDNDPNPFFCDG
jgi:hypothetical protein